MLLPGQRSEQAYERIKGRASGNSVLIFVAPECDALCACATLTVSITRTFGSFCHQALHGCFLRMSLLVWCAQELLQSDMIQYTLKPVSGLDDIVKANKELIENSEEVLRYALL